MKRSPLSLIAAGAPRTTLAAGVTLLFSALHLSGCNADSEGGGNSDISGGATGGAGGATGGASGTTGGADGSGVASLEASLAAQLGKPSRLLVGLGSTDPKDIQDQGITPDILERYLVGAGQNLENGWQTWNSPEGAYVDLVAGLADSVGAIPMFSLYMSTARGEGNLTYLEDETFMTEYWRLVKLMFERLSIYGKPALINVEPDFWGFVESQAPSYDPTKVPVKVTLQPECADFANDLTGMVACQIQLARQYAPKARLGYPPSAWGAASLEENIAFMKKLGVGASDFTVLQTVDRDAGCHEAGIDDACTRAIAYLDESNTTSPNFKEYLETAKKYRDGLGVPLIWWQTPLGVSSDTPGGTPQHYRDNRVHYFLTHPEELVDVGGVGIVFGAGWGTQTNITTDGGQFRTLSTAYFEKPAPLR